MCNVEKLGGSGDKAIMSAGATEKYLHSYGNSVTDTCTRQQLPTIGFTVFCSLYCYNGLLRERQFELVGYAVGMSIILLYVIINFCMEGIQEDYARLVSNINKHCCPW